MRGLGPYVVGALVAAVLSEYLVGPATSLPNGAASNAVAIGVDRTQKHDRLTAGTYLSAKTAIAVVEVVGVHNTAIIYRDRDGRELFRTDPLSNVTIVARD